MADRLGALEEAGVLDAIDLQVARGLARLGAESREEVALAVALASRALRQGHVCIHAAELGGAKEAPPGFAWPEKDAWLRALEASPLVGGAGDVTPLVLDGDALYLRRYFRYEARLAENLRARAVSLDETVDGKLLRKGLDTLFPEGEDVALQRRAALVAVVGRFCIISGGPGTGKTTTVAKILALLVEQAKKAGKKKLHVVLLAPTGKAAARLHDAILAQVQSLRVSPEVRDMIPDVASTIHRALKPYPGSLTRFRHGRDLPLQADVVLVDEASMVDLALMTKLVDAVPPHARLILLGDRNQLASVEAGAILGDLCGTEREPAFSRPFVRYVANRVGDELPLRKDAPEARGIGDCVVQLRRNWRYPPASGIARLADAINDGDQAATRELLAAPPADLAWYPSIPKGELGDALEARVRDGYRAYLEESDGAACFKAFNRFRVLCAHRSGSWGVEQLNPLLEAALEKARLFKPAGGSYAKRPILVTQNDYQVNLFNGDVGIVLPAPSAGGAMHVWFFAPDGSSRVLAPSRLPPHETVLAMTVHKAQGSEFDEVAVVLPTAESQVLTRELLYTAVTRPRKRVVLFGDADVIVAAVGRPVERASRLRHRLWG
jgi:exodeoxyribonuclease V alpha subunit